MKIGLYRGLLVAFAAGERACALGFLWTVKALGKASVS